ncbi:uncharacterized protein LOC742487 isoform X2 [Pan troglodytes]|uniref:uncharacterized protein LOC742487 isoform X2 n=1 Tax=Pan troglodytes TaxID=9598 RepID=UPI0030141B68
MANQHSASPACMSLYICSWLLHGTRSTATKQTTGPVTERAEGSVEWEAPNLFSRRGMIGQDELQSYVHYLLACHLAVSPFWAVSRQVLRSTGSRMRGHLPGDSMGCHCLELAEGPGAGRQREGTQSAPDRTKLHGGHSGTPEGKGDPDEVHRNQILWELSNQTKKYGGHRGTPQGGDPG